MDPFVPADFPWGDGLPAGGVVSSQRKRRAVAHADEAFAIGADYLDVPDDVDLLLGSFGLTDVEEFRDREDGEGEAPAGDAAGADAPENPLAGFEAATTGRSNDCENSFSEQWRCIDQTHGPGCTRCGSSHSARSVLYQIPCRRQKELFVKVPIAVPLARTTVAQHRLPSTKRRAMSSGAIQASGTGKRCAKPRQYGVCKWVINYRH